MVMTDPATVPGPPLIARLWPRLAERLADRPARPDLIDWAIAAGCFVAFTVPVLPDAASGGQAGAAAAFGALAAAPLVVRRRFPVLVVLAVTAVYVVAALSGVSFTPFISSAGPNLAVAVFTAADRCGRPWSVRSALVAGALTWASTPLAAHLHPEHGQDAVQLIFVAVAWVLGDMVRSLRGYRQQVQALERSRAGEEIRLARAEERVRLSREVHDVVSHSLSTIAVQAGVARLVLDRQPGQAGAALSAIETASRSALDELRNLLRQIRDPEDTDEVATPALADLPALIDRVRRAGLDVTCRTTGQPRAYGTAVEFSAYRIVQEALTNVTKHAVGARTRVEVGHGDGALTITVSDDGGRGGEAARGSSGERPGPGGAGLGLPGMRERAGLLGGTLSAGPGPDGGFTVTARLPAGRRTGSAATGEPR
jgi:signal transduction histidine kinase